MSKYISVYGTLRKGERANDMLEDCEFLGTTVEKINFKMYNCGSFPALVESQDVNEITFDTYKLPEDSEMIERRLDNYEGYREDGSGLYDKCEIELHSGLKSIIYYMIKGGSFYCKDEIKSGNWKIR